MSKQAKLLIMKIMSEIYGEHFVKNKKKTRIILVDVRKKVRNSRISQSQCYLMSSICLTMPTEIMLLTGFDTS